MVMVSAWALISATPVDTMCVSRYSNMGLTPLVIRLIRENMRCNSRRKEGKRGRRDEREGRERRKKRERGGREGGEGGRRGRERGREERGEGIMTYGQTPLLSHFPLRCWLSI